MASCVNEGEGLVCGHTEELANDPGSEWPDAGGTRPKEYMDLG